MNWTMNIERIKNATQIHQALILRFAILMLIYSISRILFYFLNIDLFSETTVSRLLIILAGGTRFDLSALLFINAIYILSQTIPFRFRYKSVYQKITDYFFLISNSVFIAINTGDIVYYRFIFKRTTGSVIDNFINETNLGKLFLRFIFIDYWYLTLIFIVLVVVLVWLYKKTAVREIDQQRKWSYYPSQFVLMLIFIYFSIIGMRSGFTGTTRPITLNNAGQYVERPKEMALVLNTPFSIFKTFDRQTFQKVNFFNEEDLKEIYSPIHNPNHDEHFQKKNVVILIIESLGREYIGALNEDYDNNSYKGYTPFLDSLISHSLTFKYSFANGYKSIDAIPSVISSIPSLRGSYVLSNYSTNDTPSLAFALKEKGYHTAFFHGAPNGSMGFLAYTTLNGFDEYYGKDEFNNDDHYDGIWGIWDEEFFQFFAHTMDSFKEPFLTTMFSVSSHHPYKVPKKYRGQFPKGDLQIHQTIGYTDYALKKFFETASKSDWYKNTLFVITADHANQSFYKKYQTSLGRTSVPIIFFSPSHDLLGYENKVAQQIDIAPTILNHLNYDQPFFAYGTNLLSDSTLHFSICSSTIYYQMAMNDYFIQFDGENTTQFYDLKTDELLLENLIDKNLPAMDSSETVIKAIIQQYNNRMIDNDLKAE